MRVWCKWPSLISAQVESPEEGFVAIGGKACFYPEYEKTYVLKEDVKFLVADEVDAWEVIVPKGSCLMSVRGGIRYYPFEAWEPARHDADEDEDEAEAYYLEQELTCLVDDDDDDPEWELQRAEDEAWELDHADHRIIPGEAVRFCRKYYPNMPEEECIKAYETYLMYLDEGQTREVSRMYAGLL